MKSHLQSKGSAPAEKVLAFSEARKYKLPKHPDLEAQLFAVAELITQRFSNPEIAEQLKLAPSKVRRLITLAHGLKLFKVDFTRASDPLIAEKAIQMANRSPVFEALQELAPKRRLKFYKAIVAGPANADWESTEQGRLARLEAFATEAASSIAQALTNAEGTLITYGTTLKRSFSALDFRTLNSKMRVYPACCDPFEYVHCPWCSTQLAHWITRQQGLPVDQHPSLAGLMPIICPKYNPKVRQVLSENIGGVPDYQKIYNDGGLADQANCLVTSIGRSEQPWILGDDYFAKTVGISRDELHELIHVEIGSVPLPRGNLSPQQRQRFDQINESRRGLRLDHIRKIADKGATSPAPGVIVLAMGTNKAPCILELIKLGLINIAIVDTTLEAALWPLLVAEMKLKKD